MAGVSTYRKNFHAHLSGAWLLILFLSLSPGTSRAGVAGLVGDAPLEAVILRSETEAKEEIGRSLAVTGGKILLVSPHDYLSRVLIPLRKRGVLTDLQVILPIEVAFGPDDLEGIRKKLEAEGVPEGDRSSFRWDNTTVSGRIDGMPVSIYTLPGYPRQEAPRLVVVDTSFFPAVYRNEVTTPMIGLVIRLARTLTSRNVTAGKVLILDALGRADFPLEHGFLPHLLKELLGDPESFSRGLPERWAALAAADHAYFFAQYPEAVTQYREYMDLAGRVDPSACYKVALMTARDLDAAMALQWINKAAASDNVYRRAYGEAAEYLFRKELYEQAESILKGGLERFPRDPPLATALAALYIQRAEAIRDTGDEPGARAYLQLASEVEGASPLIKERLRSLSRPPGGDRSRE